MNAPHDLPPVEGPSLAEWIAAQRADEAAAETLFSGALGYRLRVLHTVLPHALAHDIGELLPLLNAAAIRVVGTFRGAGGMLLPVAAFDLASTHGARVVLRDDGRAWLVAVASAAPVQCVKALRRLLLVGAEPLAGGAAPGQPFADRDAADARARLATLPEAWRFAPPALGEGAPALTRFCVELATDHEVFALLWLLDAALRRGWAL